MDYPATITVQSPPEMDRWRPLAQWILAIPHLMIAGAMEYVSGALVVVSWFVILFTGRLPKGLADFQIMILRYSLKAQLYAGFLHTEYPAFDFRQSNQDPESGPVSINIEPTLENRNRLTVGLRFLTVIPALLFALVISVVGAICWFLAFFVILFTGSWPEGLRNWVMALNRVTLRLQAYALLLTDEYPPFVSD